jgi:chromosome segregation protein
VAGLQQEVQAAQERVRAHEKSQRAMTGLVEEFQHEMEERAIVYRRQQDELGKARTALAVKRQEAKSLRQQLESQQALARDLKVQVGQQVTRLQEHEKQSKSLQEAIARHQTTLLQAQARAQSLASDLQSLEEKLAAVDQQIATVEQQRVQMQQAKTEQESLYRRVLLDSQKARDALETFLTQLQEEMGISDPQELSNRAAPVQAVTGEEANNHNNSASNGYVSAVGNKELSEEEEALLKRLRRRIDSLRSRLKAMGGCDVNAPQIYEETRTRYEFLSTQIDDMDQAAMHLRSIIGQLDVTMARQFEATFQAVNARFREHFTTLFNGGNARLELMAAKGDNNDDSPAPSSMPAGIEVIVQPPGKKVQDLSLLSGGERALVSAALLFSLLEINPPPFCLLDEVDAALDESNVTRFCDILKRLAQRTQFIVITHNRVTMTAAQVIYGVSMKDSVSRLLSMRLEEATAAVG